MTTMIVVVEVAVCSAVECLIVSFGAVEVVESSVLVDRTVARFVVAVLHGRAAVVAVVVSVVPFAFVIALAAVSGVLAVVADVAVVDPTVAVTVVSTAATPAPPAEMSLRIVVRRFVASAVVDFVAVAVAIAAAVNSTTTAVVDRRATYLWQADRRCDAVVLGLRRWSDATL
jgi:hypothetical protein